ncbi:MAG: DegT/DnrJ/EryC1/StrS family aminotransferase [Verrucomicrobia bacterium]|nr:DegT/DnrJ/EryC1/StrS family aminotransferase [Verrucomicrobiota bacterium]
MHVPLLELTAQNRPLEAELNAAFARVLRSGQYILGPELDSFEHQVAALTHTRHAIGVSSGTDAILLALMTLGVGPGDEVLCPSFTFFATAGCVARVGARPVFVDSCPVCFNLDVADAARKVTPWTKAIIPVHLFGQAAEMDGVLALAHAHGLAVIEDAAQALGAGYRGRKVGGLGTMGVFSFFPTKNLGGFGDSGMLVTHDDRLADKARLLRVHGARARYYHQFIGANFRMDPLQAALLSVKLPHYDAYTSRRRENAAYYTDRLSKFPNVVLAAITESRCLSCGTADRGTQTVQHGTKHAEHARRNTEHARPDASPAAESQISDSKSQIRLVLPSAYPHNDPIWNQYTLRVPGEGRRDALKAWLARKGIGSETYYPVPLHRQECFAYLGGAADALPNANLLASQCLSIPIYPELTRAQRDEVVDAIREFLEQV